MVRYTILAISVFCLFSFKINLFSHADTGIRIDDFLILLIALFIILYYSKKNIIRLPGPVVWISIYVLWSIFSAIINSYITKISLINGILFSVRYLEYALIFYMGYTFSLCGFSFKNYFIAYLVYSIVVTLLIDFELIIGSSKFSSSRVFANTSGPYEYAVLVGFGFIYFFSNKVKFLSAASLVMLILTYSRVTLIATLISFIFLLKNKHKPGFSVNFVAAFSVLLLGFYVFGVEGNRYSRFFSYETFDSVVSVVEMMRPVETHAEYLRYAYDFEAISPILEMSGDVSALVRFGRWLTLTKSVAGSYFSLIWGMGPSFASVAVDGYYVRVLAETGVIGLIIFLLFLRSSYCQAKNLDSIEMQCLIIILVLSGFFIDIFSAYKVMFLFWFYFGCLVCESEHNSEIR